MRRTRQSAWSVSAAALSLVLGSTASADHKPEHNPGGGNAGGGSGGGDTSAYEIIAFEPFGTTSPYSHVSDVNEMGTAAVGAAELADGTVQSASLNLLTGEYTPFAPGIELVGLNNQGQFVGHEQGQGMYWGAHDAVPVNLPPLAGDTISFPFKINDAGIVLGQSSSVGANSSSNVLWQVIETGTAPVIVNGPYVLPTNANSDPGTLARGLTEASDGSVVVSGYSGVEAATWEIQLEAGELVLPLSLPQKYGTLGLKDPSGSVAYNSNGDGDIVGISDGLPILIESDSSMSALDVPRRTAYGQARDINQNGTIVGELIVEQRSGYVGPPNFDAYIWEDGIPTALESLISRKSNWEQLSGAFDIAENGIIAGGGTLDSSQTRGFLMIPSSTTLTAVEIPEPTTLSMIVTLVCVGLGATQRNRSTSDTRYSL